MGELSMGSGLAVAAFVVGVPAIAGVLALVLGIRRRRRVQRLFRSGQRITAVVAGNQTVVQSEGRDTFLPVVRFHTRTGGEVRTALDGSPSYRLYQPDMPMDIIYDPADPQHAMPVDGPGDRGVVAIIVGFGFIGFAVCAYFFAMAAGFLE